MYLLDSSAIIELLGNSPKGKKIEELVGEMPLAATTISFVEVISGVKGKAIVAALEFFDSVLLFDFDKGAAHESIWIEKELRRTGQLIGRSDLYIAGICKSNNVMLVTCDNDFKKIKSITCYVI